MTLIAKGDHAPDFDLPGHDGKRYKLSDFKGRPVVLAFYPLDFSPICSRETTCFQNDLAQFNHLDAQVLGISVDHVWAHKVFAERLRVSYPLLADFQPRGEVAEKYGLFLPEKGHSARATVVVDRHGKVLEVKLVELPEQRNNEDVLALLRKLDEQQTGAVLARMHFR
jgi:peroxiredoxin